MAFHSTKNIIRMIKSTKTREVGHVSLTGKNKNTNKNLIGKHERKRGLATIALDRKQRILKIQGVRKWTGFSWLRSVFTGGNLGVR
jgi:hypothetical protein